MPHPFRRLLATMFHEQSMQKRKKIKVFLEGSISIMQQFKDRYYSYTSQKSMKSFFVYNLLAQLVEHQTTVQKLVGSNA